MPYMRWEFPYYSLKSCVPYWKQMGYVFPSFSSLTTGETEDIYKVPWIHSSFWPATDLDFMYPGWGDVGPDAWVWVVSLHIYKTVVAQCEVWSCFLWKKSPPPPYSNLGYSPFAVPIIQFVSVLPSCQITWSLFLFLNLNCSWARHRSFQWYA